MTLYEEFETGFGSDAVCQHALESFAGAERFVEPYTYWNASDVLPLKVVRAICNLPFKAPYLGGVSGKREKHNATRTYFDAQNRKTFAAVEAAAQAFQTPQMTQAIEKRFGTSLAGSYLRMEYAQDIDGFWLQPHSDLGVKLFTMLLYLSDDPAHAGLGTDIYDANKTHVGSSPFVQNNAMIFVPCDNTFHGFEPRSFTGVRKTLIVNYVTDDWRAREQLSFPDAPIGHC